MNRDEERSGSVFNEDDIDNMLPRTHSRCSDVFSNTAQSNGLPPAASNAKISGTVPTSNEMRRRYQFPLLSTTSSKLIPCFNDPEFLNRGHVAQSSASAVRDLSSDAPDPMSEVYAPNQQQGSPSTPEAQLQFSQGQLSEVDVLIEELGHPKSVMEIAAKHGITTEEELLKELKKEERKIKIRLGILETGRALKGHRTSQSTEELGSRPHGVKRIDITDLVSGKVDLKEKMRCPTFQVESQNVQVADMLQPKLLSSQLDQEQFSEGQGKEACVVEHVVEAEHGKAGDVGVSNFEGFSVSPPKKRRSSA